MTREKGKRNPCPTLYDNDSRPNSILAHTISRDPHEKNCFRKIILISPLLCAMGCSYRTWWIIRSTSPNPFRGGLFVLDRSDRPSHLRVRHHLSSSAASSFTHSP